MIKDLKQTRGDDFRKEISCHIRVVVFAVHLTRSFNDVHFNRDGLIVSPNHICISKFQNIIRTRGAKR